MPFSQIAFAFAARHTLNCKRCDLRLPLVLKLQAEVGTLKGDRINCHLVSLSSLRERGFKNAAFNFGSQHSPIAQHFKY